MAGGAAIGSAIAGIVGGLFDSGINLANSIYNVQQNERNFDYQKALQQVIFQREDTAVQRRMADLKAAGLNPNLAAGSAAGAGAVVGRNSTPSLGLSGNPIGTALDTMSAISQLRMQREQNQILKNQKEESAAKATLAQNEAVLDNIRLNTMLGLKSGLYWDEDGLHVTTTRNSNYKSLDFENNLLLPILKYDFNNQKNSADLLQKDVDFYTADKIADYFGAGIKAFSGFSNGYYNFNRRR